MQFFLHDTICSSKHGHLLSLSEAGECLSGASPSYRAPLIESPRVTSSWLAQSHQKRGRTEDFAGVTPSVEVQQRQLWSSLLMCLVFNLGIDTWQIFKETIVNTINYGHWTPDLVKLSSPWFRSQGCFTTYLNHNSHLPAPNLPLQS